MSEHVRHKVTEKGRGYVVTWPKCTLRMTVEPTGDECADISIKGSGREELWALGMILRRLSDWSSNSSGFIDEALRDEGVRFVGCDTRDVVVSAASSTVNIADEYGWYSMKFSSRGSGLKAGVNVADCSPGPQGFWAMGLILERLFRESRTPLGFMPGENIKPTIKWAAQKWRGGDDGGQHGRRRRNHAHDESQPRVES